MCSWWRVPVQHTRGRRVTSGVATLAEPWVSKGDAGGCAARAPGPAGGTPGGAPPVLPPASPCPWGSACPWGSGGVPGGPRSPLGSGRRPGAGLPVSPASLLTCTGRHRTSPAVARTGRRRRGDAARHRGPHDTAPPTTGHGVQVGPRAGDREPWAAYRGRPRAAGAGRGRGTRHGLSRPPGWSGGRPVPAGGRPGGARAGARGGPARSPPATARRPSRPSSRRADGPR